MLGISQQVVGRVLREQGIQSNFHASGPDHGSWKGGRVKHRDGYVLVRLETDSQFVSMRLVNGYVMEHRLKMAKHLGRPLLRSETVHHINGKRDDNRIENLQLRQGKHGNGQVAVCLDCGSRRIGHAKIADA